MERQMKIAIKNNRTVFCGTAYIKITRLESRRVRNMIRRSLEKCHYYSLA